MTIGVLRQSRNRITMKRMNARNRIYVFLTALVLLSVSSCAKICTVPEVSVDVGSKTVSIAESEFPCKKVDSFQVAAEYTIKAIYSPKFEEYVSDHIDNHIGEGPHAKAWEGLKAVDIVQKMREEIDGTSAETYGGIVGWWKFIFYGNIAFDGTENGPIRFNRIPLKKRTSADIANTIGHEVAHRIGLSHPHSDDDLQIAAKEPPYVIGDIVERIVSELFFSSK